MHTHPTLRLLRLLEVFLAGGLALAGVAVLVLPRPRPLGGLVLLALAAFTALMFELRLRGARRSIARVEAQLRAVAERDLEAPVSGPAVRASGGEDEVSMNPRLAGMLARRALRFEVEGRWAGRPVEIGTAVIFGRDFDFFVSHVRVSAGPRPSFRVSTRSTLGWFARLGTPRQETKTGDTAFDEAWVVDAAPALTTAVLDARTRAVLLELGRRVDFGVASVEAGERGAILRWPAEVDVAAAATLRDVLLDLDARLAAAA